MGCTQGDRDTLGQYALVAYIPEPLATYLNELRIELTPASRPKAHVTILPPRPHDDVIERTVGKLAADSRPFHSFQIEIGDVGVFAASSVIYLELAEGADELRELYRTLNSGSLAYAENFPYHPHVTLAQNISAEAAPALAARARERWARYRGPRGFVVKSLSFVRNVEPFVWMDVATIELGAPIVCEPEPVSH